VEHDFKQQAELISRMNDLERAVSQVAQANVVSGILQNGFESVIEELRPLRDLAPRRASVAQPAADAVAALLAAMQGVALTGGSLGIPEVSVPFIGQPKPQAVLGATGQTGAVSSSAAGPQYPG
jgi:hypothetical protein